ncbi:enterochelin esterase [Streptomyces piniterrae]|uniref:Enterochelin esterase n=1 Tax=Streptomyces piniterrae TaxID=2571125 RepID=A0A4U0NVX5_9ACTN|nr:enterochelin esterase [Streptomyces piniterrae]TJZ58897.1 enterochelin esterase [Streptomyces piniterrae]
MRALFAAPATAATSSRIARLTARLADAAPDELTALQDEFWAAAERDGTPLIEPLDGDPDHHAVTFLWRGHRATRQVLLLAGHLTDRDHLAGSLLGRIPGTDIWHRTHRLRADHRGSYRLVADISPGPPPTAAEPLQQRLRGLSAHAAPDPLNSHTLPGRRQGPGSSLFELPKAPAQPWRARRAGIPRGTVERHRRPGTPLGDEHDIFVYVPPGAPPAPLDVLVLCDGDIWFGALDAQHTFDALIADGAVPPLLVLAPGSGDNVSRGREVGARDPYADFLADELLPWAAARWPVTTDPARTVVAGQSLGGLAALYACLRHPDRFGNALAQSPSLWWRPGLPHAVPKTLPEGAPWLARRFTDAAPGAIRVHLDVGLHEGATVELSRAFHDALDAHGHPVTRTEFNGGHDYACWRGGLADGVVALLGR